MSSIIPCDDASDLTIGGALAARAAETSRSHQRLVKTKRLLQVERRLVRSCERVVLLNDRIRGLSKRYQSARAENFKSFRYNIRIRLAVVEGVRNMYYEYARDRAEEVAELRKELYDQNVHIITNSGRDSDVDDDVTDLDSDISDDDVEIFDGASFVDEPAEAGSPQDRANPVTGSPNNGTAS